MQGRTACPSRFGVAGKHQQLTWPAVSSNASTSKHQQGPCRVAAPVQAQHHPQVSSSRQQLHETEEAAIAGKAHMGPSSSRLSSKSLGRGWQPASRYHATLTAARASSGNEVRVIVQMTKAGMQNFSFPAHLGK